MGRWETGAITTGQCLQVNISAFTPHIKKGVKLLEGNIKYGNGSDIGVTLTKKENGYFAGLIYTKTTKGEKHPINYEVRIVSNPSNLGKGSIYYFICPFSGKRCKVLYLGYDSLYFKSRKAYKNRIYYPSQISSYLSKHNDQYWNLDKKLDNLYSKATKKRYKGQKTKTQVRIERLEQKQAYHDKMRWIIVPKAVLKSMAMFGGKRFKRFILSTQLTINN